MNQNMEKDADVIIIGAGLSGMTVAKELTDAGKSVLIFDGKDRVGGRTWSDTGYDKGAIDFGGMFIGATHDRSLRLGQELGLEMVKARPSGRSVWLLGEEVITAEDGSYPERVLSDGNSLKEALAKAFGKLDALATQVGKDNPWAAPEAQELDSQTMATWIEANVPDPLARSIVGGDVTIITGADPAEVSLLFFAYYIAQCEDMYALQVTANVALWVGGAGQIAERIAKRVGAEHLRLSEPVIGIDHSVDGVTVTTLQGSYCAARAVLALPPSAAAQIRFLPELPDARRQINRRTNFGRYMKLQLRYDTRFWLTKGLSGEVFSTDPAFLSLDVTRPGDAHGTLAIFIGGSAFDAWYGQGANARREAILQVMARALGAGALIPSDYIETCWNEVEFTMGGPVSVMPTGLLSTAGAALRAPIGRLHFAGTEAAPGWTGYMEGAVRAGEAAAAQIKEELSQ